MEEVFSLRILKFDYYFLQLDNEGNFINKSVKDYLKKNPDVKFLEIYKKEKSLLTDNNNNNSTISNIEDNYNEFMKRKINFYIILKIFGSTYRGQKCCLNIHNYFPYFYIEITKENYFHIDDIETLKKFAEILECACFSYIQRNDNNHMFNDKITKKNNQLKSKKFFDQIIHKIEVVEKLNFYGYYKNTGIFLKISVYNPKAIPILMDILNKGSINGKQYQCYEAHISLCMHFFSDFNLYGMNLIKFNKFSLRYFLKNEVLLRNDIENYNCDLYTETNLSDKYKNEVDDRYKENNLKTNEIGKSTLNYIYSPENIFWNKNIFGLKENQKNDNYDLMKDQENYEDLINYSDDLKIWDFNGLKKKHGKVSFNNLK